MSRPLSPFHTVRSSQENRQPFISWIIFLLGLAVWISVQGYLVSGPLTQRDQLPEVDDSLAYLTRTEVSRECPARDCRALTDLKTQFHNLPSEPDIMRQSEIAGFAFPAYHPLFSTLLLSITHFSNDLTRSYRILWLLAPLFWGVAFSCLLSTLWGRTVAGITLILVAFKVFPGSGIHYLTPGNLAMMLSLFIWARILSRDGFAPLTLILGSLTVLAIHPISIILTLISILLSLLLSEKTRRKQLFTILLLSFTACGIILVFTPLGEQFQGYSIVNPLHLFNNIKEVTAAFFKNILEIIIQLVRYKTAFIGSLIVLLPATLTGFFLLEEKRRKRMTVFLAVYFCVLIASLFHSHALTPNAALFFRLFIPFAVVLFGALPQFLVTLGTGLLHPTRPPLARLGISSRFPAVVLLAVLTAYILETMAPGMVQVETVRAHMIKRQPLAFSKSQPQLLLSKAGPTDRVLYGSTMVMAYYFVNGALQTGAVYYHPAFTDKSTSELLQDGSIRFAAVYNPGVFHPSYSGLDEKNRCISAPELSFSPLSAPRKFGPINQNGIIPVKNYLWMDVYPGSKSPVARLRILINNPGKSLTLVLLRKDGDSWPSPSSGTRKTIPANWQGWLNFPIREGRTGESYRFLLPFGNSAAGIGGITFEDNNLHWPWARQASLVLQGRHAETGRVQLSFNPSDLLPEELQNRPVEVIDDQGSSVLLRLGDQPMVQHL